ncbi:hypothetical protein AB9M62_25515 [Bacillales bacterium AN1005]
MKKMSLVTSYDYKKRITDILAINNFSFNNPVGIYLGQTSKSGPSFFVQGKMGLGKTQLEIEYFKNLEMYKEGLSL